MFNPIRSQIVINEGVDPSISSIEVHKAKPASVFVSLPALDQSASEELTKKSLFPLNEKRLEQELEILLRETGQEIETALEKISQDEKEQQVISGALMARRYLHDYVDFYAELAKQGVQPSTIEFLQKNFPAEFMNNPRLTQSTDLAHTILSSFTVFLHVTDVGATGLILMCRARLLAASKQALALTEKSLENEKGNVKTASEQSELERKEKALKEWKANLNLEEKELAYEASKFGWRTATRFFSDARLLDHFLPHGHLAGSQAALQGLGWIAAGFSVILSTIILKRTSEDYSLIQEWVKEHDKKETPIPINQLATHADQLLSKRQKALQDKKEILKKRPPEILMQQLKEFKREEFNGLYHQLENTIIPIWLLRDTKVEHIENQLENILGPLIPPQKSQADYLHYIEDHKEEIFHEWFTLQEQSHLESEFQRHFDPLIQKLFSKKISVEDFLIQFKQIYNISLPEKQTPFEYATYLVSHKPQIYQEWLKTKVNKSPSEALMEQYIEKQETITQLTKASLKPALQKKHSIEKSFLKFKLFESSTAFTILMASLAITATIALLGLSLTPAGSLAIFILTMTTTAIGIGFVIAGEYLLHKKNPSFWSDDTFKIDMQSKCAKLKLLIQDFSRKSKYKKLVETAKVLKLIRQKLKNSLSTKEKGKFEKENQRALKNYESARQKYLEQCQKVDEWNIKIQDLEQKVLNGYWKDFANHAKFVDFQQKDHPTIQFSTIKAWEEALESLDIDLMDSELKTLMNIQIGLDMDAVRKEVQHDPALLRKTLQKFFSLDNADLALFIRRQKERQALNLI